MAVALVVAMSSSVIAKRDYHRDSGLHIIVAITAVGRYNRATAKACEHDRCEKGKQGFSHVTLQ